MDKLDFLLEHKVIIHTVSIVVSLLLGLVLLYLRRTSRILHEKKWIAPFVWTFFVVAVAYFLRFLNWVIAGKRTITLEILLAICSGITNYLYFLSAFRLLDMESRLIKLLPFKKKFIKLQEHLVGKTTMWALLLLFLVSMGLVRLAGGWEARIPGYIFSTLALCVMGGVLYQNISRRDNLMAWFALLSAICYAVLYIFYIVVHYYFSSANASDPVELLVAIFALPLKCFLFFSGFSLMLWISGPVEGIERLLDSVTRRQKELFENEGIVKSICEELQVKSVSLYIKLPGLKENQLVLYSYPSPDSRNKLPQKLDYKEGTDYDHVMKSGKTHVVYSDNHRYSLLPKKSNVAVPLFFHDSVIACLEAEIGQVKFTKADQDDLLRIATLISPAVQSYREVSALNKISEDLARLQLEVVSYDIERDVENIVETVQNIVSPLGMGVSIESGFLSCRGTYPKEGDLATLLNNQLDIKIIEEDMANDSGDYLWLKKALEISPVDANGDKVETQFIGKFVFVTNRNTNTKDHPTLATNFLYHSSISILITDILLDFIRGYLNQLTDNLGVELSGLQDTEPEDWFDKIQAIAQDAGMSWTVASYSDKDEMLGDSKVIKLITRLEQEEQKVNWKDKKDGLSLYSLNRPEAGIRHVIKKEISGKKQVIWFGLARQGFGLELDYTSPWKFFIDHFCDIAHSALNRILTKKKEEERKKQIVEFQGLATAAITTGTVIHQLVNHVRNLTHPLMALEYVPKESPLNGQRRFLAHMRQSSDQIDELVKLFAGVVKPDERRPCYLDEVVKHALELLKDSLTRYAIRIKYDEFYPRPLIDVPFHVAATTLVNVINNAKDAIRDGSIKNGLIRISVEEGENMFICHVTDNGQGVPPAIQKTLFKGVSKSDKAYSHGIGLYLSAHSLRENGGDIILTQQGPVPNTTFSIRFPKIRNS